VQNGLNLNAVPTSTQNVVIGIIIVLAVGIDMWRDELGRIMLFARARLRGAMARNDANREGEQK